MRRICNTYCFSITTMVARTHLNVTLYVQCWSWFSPLVKTTGIIWLWQGGANSTIGSGKSDASILCIARHRFFCLFFFLHHTSNYVGNISIFYVPLFNSVAKSTYSEVEKKLEHHFPPCTSHQITPIAYMISKRRDSSVN